MYNYDRRNDHEMKVGSFDIRQFDLETSWQDVHIVVYQKHLLISMA